MLPMIDLKKYKLNVILNTTNLIKDRYVIFKVKKSNLKINYIFKKSTKIIRSFINLYSIFLIFLNFNQFVYNSKLEFKLNVNNILFLFVDSSYEHYTI